MLKVIRRRALGVLLLLAYAATAFAANPNRESLAPDTGGGVSVVSTQVAANTTAIVIKATPGLLYGITAWNNNSTIYYGKVYDLTSETCGSGTPKDRFMIPAASAGGAGFVFAVGPIGVTYANGILVCITAGYADSDTTAPTVSQAEFSVYFN
jgi:hypothetical protein